MSEMTTLSFASSPFFYDYTIYNLNIQCSAYLKLTILRLYSPFRLVLTTINLDIQSLEYLKLHVITEYLPMIVN
jgi:hypothetical protein